MGQAAVDLGLAVLVAARCGVPAVRALVVGVGGHAVHRVAGAGVALLVKPAEQAVFLVPGEERFEESVLLQFRAAGMVVPPDLLVLGSFAIPEAVEAGNQVIT